MKVPSTRQFFGRRVAPNIIGLTVISSLTYPQVAKANEALCIQHNSLNQYNTEQIDQHKEHLIINSKFIMSTESLSLPCMKLINYITPNPETGQIVIKVEKNKKRIIIGNNITIAFNLLFDKNNPKRDKPMETLRDAFLQNPENTFNNNDANRTFNFPKEYKTIDENTPWFQVVINTR
ncbi:MAG: hypothetical protein QNJ31_06870 [Candidatus Caenarcaniphilales bacterium]|nr:hypothetical protein [Candidatus Caenarcaniphilales bacterium]